MRTEPLSPLALAAARLKRPAARARRWFVERGALTRVALLVAVATPLGVAGYLASGDDPAQRAPAWLYEGRKLSSDDLNRVSEALEAEGIERVIDRPSGKLGVKPEVKTAALAALLKRKVVPRTLEDLGGDDEAESPWMLPAERENRKLHRLEQTLKLQIEGLDPTAIVSANVRIHREKGRGFGAAPRVAAFVYLVTDGRLGHRVVKGIETFLTGDLLDLNPEAITVADQTGFKYLAAGDSSLKEQNEAHQKEEDWRDEILDDLRHIPGVAVSVLLQQVAPPPSLPAAVELPPAPAADVVVANGKVVVDPGPPPVLAAPTPVPAAPRVRANVVVQVPRSFYRLEFQSKWPGRMPTQDEILPMAATTKNIVEDAVRINIPADTLGEIKVDTVQDDLRAFQLPPAPESRRAWASPALYGGVALALVSVLAAVLVRLAGRRPSGRPAPSAWRPGLVDDGPNGPTPGPSERVRELIRLNPEAAAGVLQRWIGQGGAIG